jgi:hypothetical protein
VLCQVLEVEPGVKVKRAADGATRTIERGKVVALPAPLGDWAAGVGVRQLERLARVEMLRTLVPASAGVLPKPGAPVLARWSTDGEWWPGTAESVSSETVQVRWHDGSGPESLPRAEIAPLAPAEPNTFAFCNAGGTARYERSFVRWVSGAEIEVEHKDGSIHALPPGSCVPARSGPEVVR